MYAVISDLHSNRAALEAVFADIDAQGIDDVICLGDVVGYGPEPGPCVDLVMARARVTVMGNHEEALLHGAFGFHPIARDATDWTRDQLKPGFFSGLAVQRRWRYIAAMPLEHREGPDLFVHGSPRNHTTEYLLIQEVGYDLEKYEEVFGHVERLLFVGHSHQPCVITDRHEVILPEQVDQSWSLLDGCDGKAIVNVGSVGQPRDGNPHACYVVRHEDRIEWRRVPYDIDATVNLIEQEPRLHAKLGERLKHGR